MVPIYKYPFFRTLYLFPVKNGFGQTMLCGDWSNLLPKFENGWKRSHFILFHFKKATILDSSQGELSQTQGTMTFKIMHPL